MDSLTRYELSLHSDSTRKKKEKHSRAYLKEEWTGYLFVLIPLIGFGIFVLYPSIRSFIMSFTNYNQFAPIDQPVSFIGFNNYIKLFAETPDFWNAVLNTVVLLASIPIGITIGLLIATYINRATHGSKLLSLLYYLPAVTSAVAISIVWNYIFDAESGILNQLFGLKNFLWLDPNDFFVVKIAILIKGVWGGIGGTMLLFLAGLNSIPKEYYEAGTIDGASGFQQFVHITIPMVNPTIFYLLITNVIGHLQAYADAKLFAKGSRNGITVVYYIWEVLVPKGDIGLLGAATTFVAIVIMIITIIQFRRNKMFNL